LKAQLIKKSYLVLAFLLTIGAVLLYAATASDNFDRADAETLGANWTTHCGATTWQIVTNAASPDIDAASGPCAEHYNATTFTGNHESQATYSTAVNNKQIGPAARIQSGANTFYACEGDDNNGYYMVEVTAGTSATLASTATVLTVTDVLLISVDGSSITCKKNGATVLGPITDTSITGGQPGVAISNTGIGSQPRLDDWSGADIGAASAARRRVIN